MAIRRKPLAGSRTGMTRKQSGSMGGKKGGSQRARTLSTQQRQAIARKGGQAKNR